MPAPDQRAARLGAHRVERDGDGVGRPRRRAAGRQPRLPRGPVQEPGRLRGAGEQAGVVDPLREGEHRLPAPLQAQPGAALEAADDLVDLAVVAADGVGGLLLPEQLGEVAAAGQGRREDAAGQLG